MTKPLFFIAGGIAVLGLAAYFIYKHFQSESDKVEIKIDSEDGLEIEY